MDYTFSSTEQVSERCEPVKFELPKFGKSTTDPTYYEPAASRIANMKKASGVKLEGIYDFYTKDDVSKFNEENFSKNIHNAEYDPRYNNKLLREEVSQITTNLGNQAEEMIESNNKKKSDKAERIKESLEISSKIDSQNNKTNE